MSRFMRNLVVWVVLGSLIVYVFNFLENGSPSKEIPFSELRKEASADNIQEIIFKGDRETIVGTLRTPETKFITYYHKSKSFDEFEAIIKEKGVMYDYEQQETPSIFSQLLIGAFPIILLLAIFFFFMSYYC